MYFFPIGNLSIFVNCLCRPCSILRMGIFPTTTPVETIFQPVYASMGPFLPACHLLHIIQDFSVWGMKEPPLASALACAIFVDWNFDSSHQLMCIRTMYETRGAIFSPCTSHFRHRYLTMFFTVANTLVACVFICFLRS